MRKMLDIATEPWGIKVCFEFVFGESIFFVCFFMGESSLFWICFWRINFFYGGIKVCFEFVFGWQRQRQRRIQVWRQINWHKHKGKEILRRRQRQREGRRFLTRFIKPISLGISGSSLQLQGGSCFFINLEETPKRPLWFIGPHMLFAQLGLPFSNIFSSLSFLDKFLANKLDEENWFTKDNCWHSKVERVEIKDARLPVQLQVIVCCKSKS